MYLRNRSPTKALSGITPYEAWNGTKPDVSILRIFGCCVYAHVVKTERCKLDSKANKCVMLGYGTQQKGYCLFDLEHRRVIHSRDVVFYETKMPGLQKETTDKYVELKLEEEPIAEGCPTTTSEVSVPEESSLNELLNEEPEVRNSVSSELPLRRSTRNIVKPRYGFSLVSAANEQHDRGLGWIMRKPLVLSFDLNLFGQL